MTGIADAVSAIPGLTALNSVDQLGNFIQLRGEIYKYPPEQTKMFLATAIAFLAVLWITYRLTLLRNIPIPNLVTYLGYELPSRPRVSLVGIEQDSITLRWSLPEKPSSVSKHIIQIDGVTVGESDRKGEASVTVTGLNPDHIYNVRVIAVNQHNFQAPGQLMRLRTRRSNLESVERTGSISRQELEDVPSVQALTREPTSPLPRRNKDRRTLKDSTATDSQNGAGPSASDEKKVEALTRELNALRQEINEVTLQLTQMEEEHKAVEAAHIVELEAIKRKKKEEESARQQTKAEITALNKMKQAAEQARTKKENELKAKEAEIGDLQDEAQRWEEEHAAAVSQLDAISKDALEADEKANELEEVSRKTISEQQAAIAALEEEIKELITSIKATEAQELSETGSDVGKPNMMAREALSDQEWSQRKKYLQNRYVRASNAFKMAEEEFFRSIDTVNTWHAANRGLATTNAAMYDYQQGIHAQPMPVKKTKHRRNRNRKSRSQTVSNSSQVQLSQETPQPSETQSSSGALVPGTVATAMSAPFSHGDSLTPAAFMSGTVELDLNGVDDFIFDGPMSPSANLLLPSDLFSREQDDARLMRSSNRNSYAESGNYPQSPLSSGSQAASLISDSSPRGSFQHMPLYPSVPDTMAKASTDTTPLSQVDGPFSVPKKLSNLFNFKPRVKVNESPALGSLEVTETRSFPREGSGFNPPGSLAPIGTGRRRSGSGTSWQAGSSALESKRGISRADNESSPSAFFNPFNPKYDPLDQSRILDPVSPRPSSVASFDTNNQLPLPSSQVSAAFGWQPYDAPYPNRSLNVFNSPWGAFNQSLSANASVTSFSANGAMSTAIDTRWPHSSSRPITPRLNPIAPPFTSKATNTSSSFTPVMTVTAPPAPSTLSRDSVSIHTDASSIPSTTGSSIGNITAESSSGITKESSLLSRLSKGSTPKFNIGAWKLGRKKEPSLAGTSETGDETDLEPSPLSQPPTSAPWKRESMSLFRKKDTSTTTAGTSEAGDETEIKEKSDIPQPPDTPGSSKWGLSLYRKKEHATPAPPAPPQTASSSTTNTGADAKSEAGGFVGEDLKSLPSESSSILPAPTKKEGPRFNFPAMGRGKDKDRNPEKDREKELEKKEKEASKELVKRMKEEEKERERERKKEKKQAAKAKRGSIVGGKKGKDSTAAAQTVEEKDSRGSLRVQSSYEEDDSRELSFSTSFTGSSNRELSSVPE